MYVRCSGDNHCVIESLMSQSIAFARTAGWAVQTVETLVQRMRDRMTSKTLPSLRGAIRLMFESIAVLRKSTSEVGWKEEDRRTQAIATACSLADKGQPPICFFYGCLAGRLVHYCQGLCCSGLAKGVV